MANEFESVQLNLPPNVSAGWNDPPELPPVSTSGTTANRLKQIRTTIRPVHPSINEPSCSHYMAYPAPRTSNWTPYATSTSSFTPQPFVSEPQGSMYFQNGAQYSTPNPQTYMYPQNTVPNYTDGYGTATWYH